MEVLRLKISLPNFDKKHLECVLSINFGVFYNLYCVTILRKLLLDIFCHGFGFVFSEEVSGIYVPIWSVMAKSCVE